MNYQEIELAKATKKLLNANAAVEWRLSDLRKVWFVGWCPKRVVQGRVETFADTHLMRAELGDFGQKVTFRLGDTD